MNRREAMRSVNPPRVKVRYLHPIFSVLVHSRGDEGEGEGQEKCAIKGHETKLTNIWPRTQNVASVVRRWCDFEGMNSRKSAESMGMLPPTPKPIRAMRAARVVKVGELPEAIPNVPAMRRVRLNGHLHIPRFNIRF